MGYFVLYGAKQVELGALKGAGLGREAGLGLLGLQGAGLLAAFLVPFRHARMAVRIGKTCLLELLQIVICLI